VAHGNSNRALRKFLENISQESIKYVQMEFDKLRIYDIRPNGHAKNCSVRHIKTDKTHRY
jgi:bisphosphoglycerate-dependent phosphoglycerate mutase